MNSKLKLALLGLLGAVIGYPLMGFLITVVQEWMLGGISYTHSTLPVLFIGGIGTFLSAVAGGWVAARVVSFKTLLPNIIMIVLAIAETTWLVRTGRTTDPLWFDVIAASSLFIGIYLGAKINVLWKWWKHSAASPSS